jgi:uncharacterized protein YxeA
MGNSISFKNEFGLMIIGALIFTASFLWKDLLTDIENMYFPKHHGLIKRAIYVILITIILILLAVYIKDKLHLSTVDPTEPAVRKDNDDHTNDGHFFNQLL